MQQEREIAKLRPKKLLISPSATGIISTEISNIDSKVVDPEDGVQSLQSPPAGQISENIPYQDVYEDFTKFSNFPAYENLPLNSKITPNSASDDGTYLNERQLRLIHGKRDDKVQCKSTLISTECDIMPQHGSYVEARRPIEAKRSTNKTDTKEERIDEKNDDDSNEFGEYEEIGKLFLKGEDSSRSFPSSSGQNSKQLGPKRPVATTSLPTADREPLSPERPKENASGSSSPPSEIQLPMAKQTTKDHRNLKSTLTGIKNSIMKELRGTGPRHHGPEAKWTSVTQIPKDVDQFTIDQVSQCLRLLNFDKYVGPFKERKMNGMILTKTSEEMLMRHFQMDELEAQQLVMFAQQGWRPE